MPDLTPLCCLQWLTQQPDSQFNNATAADGAFCGTTQQDEHMYDTPSAEEGSHAVTLEQDASSVQRAANVRAYNGTVTALQRPHHSEIMCPPPSNNNGTFSISGLNEGSESVESAPQPTGTPAQQVLPVKQRTTERQFQTQVPISSAELPQMRQTNTTQAVPNTQLTAPIQAPASGHPHGATADAEELKTSSICMFCCEFDCICTEDPIEDDFEPYTLFATGNEPNSAGKKVHSVNMVRRVNRVSDTDAPVHYEVECDVTGMNPIIGTRYKKLGPFVIDYDLCRYRLR